MQKLGITMSPAPVANAAGRLALSYIASEMSVQFPKPFILNIDNSAAKAFADESCFKSKLKHIDNRQTWVKLLSTEKLAVC